MKYFVTYYQIFSIYHMSCVNHFSINKNFQNGTNSSSCQQQFVVKISLVT